MTKRKKIKSASLVFLLFGVTGGIVATRCGYGISSREATTYTISGTMSGLTGTAVLNNNSSDALSVSSNGAFSFSIRLQNAASYSVTVATQPNLQYCGVVNGTGIVQGSNVTNVSITCLASGLSNFAKSTTAGTAATRFHGVATDTSGNIYVVGRNSNNVAVGFGNGVTATGAFNGQNAMIVKYNSSGVAQWAQTTTAASAASSFSGVTTDASGNVYAVGTITNNTAVDFGNGVSATGFFNGGTNAVIVKYNSAGVAQWAQSTSVSGTASTGFNKVKGDAAGNLYVIGFNSNNAATGFGNGVSTTGFFNGQNFMIVKYNSSGVAQWAQSTTAGTASTTFEGLAVDALGNAYVSGNNSNVNPTGFGNGVSVSGSSTQNILTVKYDSSGAAQWARSTVSGTGTTLGLGVAIDSAGNAYSAGRVSNNDTMGYGNGVTATSGLAANSAFIVKYDSSGTAQWAQTTPVATAATWFYRVASDSYSNVYVVGLINSNTATEFGNGVTATGALSGNTNVLIVKYNSDGVAQWARSTTTATAATQYFDVAADTLGNVLAVGINNDNATVGFGNNTSVAGFFNGINGLLVNYTQ